MLIMIYYLLSFNHRQLQQYSHITAITELFLIINTNINNMDSYIAHQLNASKTKETHIFPKANRFLKSKKITQAMYNLPSTKSHRTTTLGYGQKINIDLKTQGPPPGTYKSSSDFERNEYDNIASMGQGRQKVTFGSFLLQAIKKSKQYPSPDRYDVPTKRSVIGGLMGERIKTQPDMKVKRQIPGPGAYELNAVEIRSKGSYILSTYKNVTSPRYFGNSEKVSDYGRRYNASMSYNIQERQNGKYAVSKYKNVITSTFSKSLRPGLEDKSKIKLPGFKYRRFSEFGEGQI